MLFNRNMNVNPQVDSGFIRLCDTTSGLFIITFRGGIGNHGIKVAHYQVYI